MASMQFSGAGVGGFSRKGPATFDALRLPAPAAVGALRPSRGLIVRAATVVASKYTTLKPLADRVVVKIKSAEQKTIGGILLPSVVQSKPQVGEVVAVGEGRAVGDNKVEVGIQIQVGAQVIYSKYAGTEVGLNDSNHLILKEDDIIAEDKTPGGLLLTETTKEKPCIGTVVAAGPGPLDEERTRSPLSVSAGNTVLYSKYAGSEFKGADGTKKHINKSQTISAERCSRTTI
ncbi:hypothetical protein ABZP36_022333 [Zizania latifolia]